VYTESSHEFMTAASTDLERFARLGNKPIVYHGVSDPVFSAHDTVRWYRGLMRRTHGRADRFARLFLIPGMNHCGGGPATDRFDALSVVVDWVERGRAPDAIAASANAASPWPSRTRPLCAFPRQARYLGQGDVDDAASFVYKAPAHARLPRRAKGHRRAE
jgi:feruloyl esterase